MLEEPVARKGRKRWLTVIVAVAAVLIDLVGAAIVEDAPRIVEVARVALGEPAEPHPAGPVRVKCGS